MVEHLWDHMDLSAGTLKTTAKRTVFVRLDFVNLLSENWSLDASCIPTTLIAISVSEFFVCRLNRPVQLPGLG